MHITINNPIVINPFQLRGVTLEAYAYGKSGWLWINSDEDIIPSVYTSEEIAREGFTVGSSFPTPVTSWADGERFVPCIPIQRTDPRETLDRIFSVSVIDRWTGGPWEIFDRILGHASREIRSIRESGLQLCNPYSNATHATVNIRSGSGEVHEDEYLIPGKANIKVPLFEAIQTWFHDITGWYDIVADGVLVVDAYIKGGRQAIGWETHWLASIPLKHFMERYVQFRGRNLFRLSRSVSNF